jgi:hypothetical protein
MVNIFDKQEQGKSRDSSGEIDRVLIGKYIPERSLAYPEFSTTISPALINKWIKELEEEERLNK